MPWKSGPKRGYGPRSVILAGVVQVCIEAAVDFPLLGRFCIRQDDAVIAVGMVKSVTKSTATVPIYAGAKPEL